LFKRKWLVARYSLLFNRWPPLVVRNGALLLKASAAASADIYTGWSKKPNHYIWLLIFKRYEPICL